MPTGSIVAGPQRVTFAPSVVRACTFERATRLWVMSPIMETFRPSTVSTCSVIVSTSRRACVGWACAPSPALRMTLSVRRARKWGAPGELWRSTTTSTFIASTLRAVSLRLSPFVTDEPDFERLTVSAERRPAARPNESFVRVEGSKKRLATVVPCRVGTCRMGRSSTARNSRAVSRM
jgi:hypothetical protein